MSDLLLLWGWLCKVLSYILFTSPPPPPHSLTLHKKIVTCSPQCNPSSFRCSFNQSWPWAWAIQIAFKSVRFSLAICLWPQRWCANVLYVVCVHERSELLRHKLRTIFWGDCHRQTMFCFAQYPLRVDEVSLESQSYFHEGQASLSRQVRLSVFCMQRLDTFPTNHWSRLGALFHSTQLLISCCFYFAGCRRFRNQLFRNETDGVCSIISTWHGVSAVLSTRLVHIPPWRCNSKSQNPSFDPRWRFGLLWADEL